MAEKPSAHARVTEIDGLRFVAAMAVAVFHYAFHGPLVERVSTLPYPELESVAKYGYMGVQLFFMISGFVILMTANGGTVRRFVVSRVSRLYPAFWICCTLTFLAILAFGGEHFAATIPQYLVNLTMFSNMARVPAIDGVYWSLFIELRFYVLVGVVLLIGQIGRVQQLLMGWLIVSVALELWPIRALNSCLVTNYAAYFIAGATLYLIWLHGPSLPRAILLSACWLVALFQDLEKSSRLALEFQTTYNPYVVMGLTSVIFFVMTLIALRKTARLAHPGWVIIGAVTYPFYLLHQNIGFMVFNATYPTINRHLLFWGMLVLMIGISYAVNLLFERRLSSLLKQWLNAIWDMFDARVSRLAWRTESTAASSEENAVPVSMDEH